MNHLNLMPTTRRRRQLRRRRLRQWTAGVVLLGLAVTAVSVADLRENRIRRGEADALARQFEPVDNMRQEIEAIRTQIETLKTQQQLAGELAKQKSVISLMGILSQAAAKREDRIGLRRLTLESKRIDSEEGAYFQRDLTLEGYALSSSDISVFSAALEESKAFERVHLESSATREFGRTETQLYTLQCSY